MHCGPKFGMHKGSITIIHNAFYELHCSTNRWHAHFADMLCTMGFTPLRFDHDVWLKDCSNSTRYDYICTYIDDFMVMAKEPMQYMKVLQEKYSICNIKEPKDYLGVIYHGSHDGTWSTSFSKYPKEAVSHIEQNMAPLHNLKTPIAYKDEPKLDDSPFLDNEDHHLYQMYRNGKMDCNHWTT